jgi:hypothetical protein
LPTFKEIDAGASAIVGIGKDLVALLRDASLMVLAVLLIFWPSTFNSILSNAGFEEGSLVGFKWKTGFAETHTQLEQTNVALVNLTRENTDLVQLLAEADKFVTDNPLRARIASVQERNKKLAERSETLQSSVEATIAQTAPLANTLPAKLQPVWAVLFASDSDLGSAQDEVGKARTKLGSRNIRIFLRNGYFASVVVAPDPTQPQRLLDEIRAYRSDAHLVNLNSWCPRQEVKTDYTACL